MAVPVLYLHPVYPLLLAKISQESPPLPQVPQLSHTSDGSFSTTCTGEFILPFSQNLTKSHKGLWCDNLNRTSFSFGHWCRSTLQIIQHAIRCLQNIWDLSEDETFYLSAWQIVNFAGGVNQLKGQEKFEGFGLHCDCSRESDVTLPALCIGIG